MQAHLAAIGCKKQCEISQYTSFIPVQDRQNTLKKNCAPSVKQVICCRPTVSLPDGQCPTSIAAEELKITANNQLIVNNSATLVSLLQVDYLPHTQIDYLSHASKSLATYAYFIPLQVLCTAHKIMSGFLSGRVGDGGGDDICPPLTVACPPWIC